MIAYMLQSNVFALIVLLVVHKGAKKHIDLARVRDRIFMALIKVNALVLVIDSVSIFLYDVPGQGIYWAQSSLNMIFFALNPVPGLLWLLYVYDYLYHDPEGIKRWLVVGSLPVVVNGLLALASIWGGYLFLIGPGNSYERGSLFFIVPTIAFSYTTLAFAMILFHRHQVRRQEWLPLLSFGILPTLGGLVQTWVYGLLVLWPAMALSLLIIYVFIQSRTLHTDYLTGFFNRRAFDDYLEDWKKWKDPQKAIACFMMDLDQFKAINDTYGHQVGDQALVAMSRILGESFRKKDFLARLGGDEFAAIIEVEDVQMMEAIAARLQEKIQIFNEQEQGSYQLSMSVGSGIFLPENGESMKAFFDRIDHKMYMIKEKKKQSGVQDPRSAGVDQTQSDEAIG